MIYSAIHITRHIYQSPVSQSLNELRLTPRSLPGQQVREVNICIEPEPATWQSRKDYFGNEVITVGVYEPHSRFVIEAKSVVEVEAPSMEADFLHSLGAGPRPDCRTPRRRIAGGARIRLRFSVHRRGRRTGGVCAADLSPRGVRWRRRSLNSPIASTPNSNTSRTPPPSTCPCSRSWASARASARTLRT